MHNGTWKYVIALACLCNWSRNHSSYRTQLSCFLRKVDENWFLNNISCPQRNILTIIIWIISSRSYTDIQNPSNHYRNYGENELRHKGTTINLACPSSGQLVILGLKPQVCSSRGSVCRSASLHLPSQLCPYNCMWPGTNTESVKSKVLWKQE